MEAIDDSMAKRRGFEPEILIDDELFGLEQAMGAPVRLVYVALATQADKRGLFEWRPRRLQAAILPMDEADIEEIMHTLWEAGYLEKYACSTRTGRVVFFGRYAYWTRDFTVNGKEKHAWMPDVPESPHGIDDAAKIDDIGREIAREPGIVIYISRKLLKKSPTQTESAAMQADRKLVKKSPQSPPAAAGEDVTDQAIAPDRSSPAEESVTRTPTPGEAEESAEPGAIAERNLAAAADNGDGNEPHDVDRSPNPESAALEPPNASPEVPAAAAAEPDTAGASEPPLSLPVIRPGPQVNGVIGKHTVELSVEQSHRFLQFWDAYGKTDGRAEAAGAWLELEEAEAEFDEEVEGRKVLGIEQLMPQILKAARLTKRWRHQKSRQGVGHIYASNWLYRRRFEDEIYTVDESSGSAPTPRQVDETAEMIRLDQMANECGASPRFPGDVAEDVAPETLGQYRVRVEARHAEWSINQAKGDAAGN